MSEDVSQEELTMEEQEQLAEALSQSSNYPVGKEKDGIFSFFKRVLNIKDSVKVSNLNVEELFSVRTLKSASLYSEIMELDEVSKYIQDEAEIIYCLSADSKEGFLIRSIITQKRELDSQISTGGDKRGRKKERFK